MQFGHVTSARLGKIYARLQRFEILHSVLLAFGVVILIFAFYEVIERLWLKEVAPRSIYWFHLARGLGASLVSGLLVGWLMFRASTPLRATTLSIDAWSQGIRPTEEERFANYVLWLILLRWIAVAVAAGLVVAARMTEIIPAEVWWPLVGTIAVLALFNVAYAVLTRYRWLNRYLLPFQAYVDLIALTILLHFSGGIENPLSMAIIFHVILAGIVLSRRQCYAVAMSAALLFALLAWGEGAGVLKHYTLQLFPHGQEQGELVHATYSSTYVLSQVSLRGVLLFLVCYFVTTLAERVRYGERQLSVLADRALAVQRLLEQALETTGAGLCVLDRELSPFWKNKRWELWFHKLPVEPLRETLQDGKARVTEITTGVTAPAASTDHNEPSRVFQITTATLRDSQDVTTHVVALAQDITQQKQTQARMVRAEKLAAVGELAGHVAHEVNNPVAIISAKSRLLLSDQRNKMSKKVAEEVAKITELAERVAKLVQGLLSYTRPSTAVRRPLDICVPIREAISLIAQRAQQLGVQIEDRLTGPLPAVCANDSEIQQVFLNLFLNALDAMRTGGRLTVSALGDPPGQNSTHVTVFVEDTGVGIPAEIRERIFEPFFTTKTQGKGTGLGLSVCAGLVRSHRGEIGLESVPSGGTRMRVTLPTECAEAS